MCFAPPPAHQRGVDQEEEERCQEEARHTVDEPPVVQGDLWTGRMPKGVLECLTVDRGLFDVYSA